jgi:hypothetical protein
MQIAGVQTFGTARHHPTSHGGYVGAGGGIAEALNAVIARMAGGELTRDEAQVRCVWTIRANTSSTNLTESLLIQLRTLWRTYRGCALDLRMTLS